MDLHALTLQTHRTLAAYAEDQSSEIDPLSHCVSAAQSCINAGELIREHVPPSHHLAFCIHYLTLSSLVLLVYQVHTTL